MSGALTAAASGVVPAPSGALSLRPRPPSSAAQNSFPDHAAAQMERLVADFARVWRERNTALDEVSQAHREMLMRLARLAELRDDDTGRHVVRVGFLSWAVALRLGLSADDALQLRQAAPMHDIGKLGIPDAVLQKTGPYTEAERELVRTHAALGAELLGPSRIPLFRLAAEIALTHHERWDGTGYPRRLAGQAIPVGGRIVALVDFFDALTMDRWHRPAYPDAKALELMAGERGGAFDPAVVDVFLRHRAEFIELRRLVDRDQLGLEDLAPARCDRS